MKKRRLIALAWLLCGCDPFEPIVTEQTPYGHVLVLTSIDGPNIQNRLDDRLGIVVALDSAVQGYGVFPIFRARDTAGFFPVIVGLHDVSFRVPPNCTVVDGNKRTGLVEYRKSTVFTFEAHCGP